jgi:tetratricopeptide (TPR) repeat protein
MAFSVDYSKCEFLIVDDFNKYREALKGMLQMSGAKGIDGSSTSKDALNRMRHKFYDVILCDYRMREGKDGRQILEEARFKKYIKPSAVFIMVSSESASDMVMGVMEYAPDSYLMKPFNQNMLDAHIKRALKRKYDIKPVYDALDKNQVDKAIQICQVLIEKNTKQKASLLKVQSGLLIDKNRPKEIIEPLNNLLLENDFNWARVNLGKAHYALHEYDKAISLFKQAIEKNVRTIEAYDWLAKCYCHIHDEKQAEEILLKAIQISPKAILRQMELGQLAFELNDMEVAEECFRDAISLGKHSVYKTPKNYSLLVKSLLPKMHGPNDAEAEKAASEALSTIKEMRHDYLNTPDVVFEATLLQAETHQTLGRFDEAKQMMEFANSMFEKVGNKLDPSIQVTLAETYYIMGDTEKAEKLAEELLEKYPEDEHLNRELGKIMENSPLNKEGMELYKDGHLEEALVKFKQAVDALPTSLSINFNALQVSMEIMKSNGIDANKMIDCKHELDRFVHLGKTDPKFERYKSLRNLYEELRKNMPPTERTPALIRLSK